MRRRCTLILALAGLQACSSTPGDTIAPSQVLTATAVPVSVARTGEVGMILASPLQVEVLKFGAPQAGVPVTWGTPSGFLLAGGSVTDSRGIAAAQWTLGQSPGAANASVWVEGVPVPVVFYAVAVAGPPATLQKLGGDNQVTGSAAVRGFADLRVAAADRFGNTTAAEFTWSIVSGPVELAGPPWSPAPGLGTARLSGTRLPGFAEVAVRAAGTNARTSFHLEVVENTWDVELHSVTYTRLDLRSLQNHSVPAMDTLPLGGTVRFLNHDEWDALNSYQIRVQGPNGTATCDLASQYDASCRITFTVPGSYSYELLGMNGAIGLVVVQ